MVKESKCNYEKKKKYNYVRETVQMVIKMPNKFWESVKPLISGWSKGSESSIIFSYKRSVLIK